MKLRMHSFSLANQSQYIHALAYTIPCTPFKIKIKNTMQVTTTTPTIRESLGNCFLVGTMIEIKPLQHENRDYGTH